MILLPDQHVDMVGHDAPRDEFIALSMPFDQLVMDDAGNVGLAKKAPAMPRILISRDPAEQLSVRFGFVIFIWRMEQVPEFLFPALDRMSGKGIRFTESDGLQRSTIIPVREVSAAMMTFRFHKKTHGMDFYGPRVFSSPHCKEIPNPPGRAEDSRSNNFPLPCAVPRGLTLLHARPCR